MYVNNKFTLGTSVCKQDLVSPISAPGFQHHMSIVRTDIGFYILHTGINL